MRKIILPIIILLVLFGGGPIGILSGSYGVKVFAQKAELPDPGLTPDSPFYFLERIVEEIGTFFTFGDLKKAERHAALAAERLAEAQVVAGKGKPALTEKTLERYEMQLEKSMVRVEKAQAKGENTEKVMEVVAKVGKATSVHLEILAEIYEKVPEQAKPAIEKAMTVSAKGHERAVEVLKEKGALGEVPAVIPVPAEVPEEVKERIQEKVKEEIEEKKTEGEISCKDSLDCPSQMKCENSVCVDVGCLKEGQRTPSTAISPEGFEQRKHMATECCEGLKSILAKDQFDKNCNQKPIPIGVQGGTTICSKCGNGTCEEWETKCNCPEDCFPVPNTPMMLDIDVSTTAGKPYTIGWRAVSGATGYILERDSSSSFPGPVMVYSGPSNSFIQTLSPSVSTRYYFRVKACNKYKCSSWSKITELWVEFSPFITVTSPNGGEIWKVGNTYTIRWESIEIAKVNINLLSQQMGAPSDTYHVRSIVFEVDATKGFYSWLVPAEIPRGSLPEIPLADYPIHKIEIVDSATKVISDKSDDYFRIIE